MSKTMRGVWCDGSSIRLRRDLPVPEPAEGEVLLRVRAAGICETDLQLARGYMGFRGILGHEFIGEQPDGRRVTAEINNACGRCPTCEAGMPGHCPNRSVLGILAHDGAMAEWVRVPRANLHEVPDSLDDREAIFIEPLAAAFQMVDQAAPGPGTRLAVLGDGKLGHLCVRAAIQSGAEVHLVGKHDRKLALAGPGVTTHRLEDAASLGRPFDVVVDCTGSPTGLPAALRLVRPRGTVVLKTTIAGRYEVDLAPIVIDEVRLIGSRCGPFPRAIAALADRPVEVRSLLDTVFSLDEAEAAFDAAARPGAGKMVLQIAEGR